MSKQDYAGQVVVVTGASAGIGAVVAMQIAERGGSVVLAARRTEAVQEVATRCGKSALAVTADVTKRADVQRLLDEAVARFGRVDIWINNAGRGIGKPLLELTDDDVDSMIRDNVKSVLYGMQVAVPHMTARGTGAVVNVSSLLGRIPFAPPRAAYAAAKAAMMSLSECMRIELERASSKVRVVVVYPGPVSTDFGQNALGAKGDNRQLPGVQTPEVVAQVLCDAALTANGDVYTQPGAVDRVREHFAKLSAS